MDASHSPSYVLPNNMGWSTFSHFICEMLNLALYLFWCVNPPHPIHTGGSIWGTVQVSHARITAVGKFCCVCTRAGMCLFPVKHVLTKVKNVWEKSVLKVCGHTSVFSLLQDTFGEEIKKTKPHTHRWGKNEFRCKHMTLKEQKEKTYHPCICLCEFNHYLRLTK